MKCSRKGKFAWSQKFEQELDQEDVDRGARQAAAYVPTFFTAPQHHQALTAARPQVTMINRKQCMLCCGTLRCDSTVSLLLYATRVF